VGQLAAPHPVSVQAISKHLKVLEQAGPGQPRAQGHRSPVHLEAEVFDLMTKWIERYRQRAEARYRRLDAVLAEMDDDTRPGTARRRRRRHERHADGRADRSRSHVPIIHIYRDFAATPAQLFRAHTDPELFARWVGPDGTTTTVDRWDASTGGSWRYVSSLDGTDFGFHGCFHEVRPDRIVQTFTWEGDPDGVALETLDFEDLGGGRTRLHAQSLCDSFEGRDAWLRSGMEVGVDQGYAKLDALLAAGEIPGRPTEPRHDPACDPAERHRAVAAAFTARVRGASDWDAPAPVAGWRARDVVGHLVDWFPGFLESATGLVLDRGPSPEEDPVAAWQVHADAVQRLLDGPEAGHPLPPPDDRGAAAARRGRPVLHLRRVHAHVGPGPAHRAGRALDPQTCADLLDGMAPIEDVLRSSGQYGPRVPVPDDADVQTRLLAFIGRDPWGGTQTTAG
jgi:uncharacterized protein YndB with AHSA1/START domain